QVALLKVASGLTDEELTWRMETAKPGANAYLVASMVLERVETDYECLLWQQSQLELAKAILTGKGHLCNEASSSFASALAAASVGTPDRNTLAQLKSAAEAVVRSEDDSSSSTATLAASVDGNVELVSEKEGVAATVQGEVKSLASRANEIERKLEVLAPQIEAVIGQLEAWRRRQLESPEYAAEVMAREMAWAEANKEANACMVGGGVGGILYPSDLCCRIKELPILHWLVSAPEDVECANFLVGEGSNSFTQLEAMDVVEMRAVWCVLPREFKRDGDGKKAEWRARFMMHLESLVRQEEGGVVSSGWDPVLGRRGTTHVPPLAPNQARHPAYFYPSGEMTQARINKLREHEQRLDSKKERLWELGEKMAETKVEVSSACADSRSKELISRYGIETLRRAREVAKAEHERVVSEHRRVTISIQEMERAV
ncbi:unnamed protein product, partial [Choristocarpus tenellus]